MLTHKQKSFIKKHPNFLPPQESTFKSTPGHDQITYFILTIIILIIYLPTLGHAFVSDDIASILQDPRIKSFSYVLSHYSGPIRPLLYFLAYQLGGPNPPLFRLINISFHLGSTLLLFKIAKFLYNFRVAFFAAVLFAVHPALTEAVTWISAGNYSQASFFTLLSLLLYLKSNMAKRFYLPSLLSYLLALMSQAVPLVLMPILIFHELTYGSLAKNWRKIIPYFLLGGIFLSLSFSSISSRQTTLREVHYQQRGMDNPLLIVPIAVSSYLDLLFWPSTLTIYHSELVFTTVQYLLMIIIFLSLVAVAIYGFFKERAICLWISFFFFSLLPTMVPAILRLTWIVAERYLYLASVGIFMLIGLLLDKLVLKFKAKEVIYSLLVVIILALGTRSILRNGEWRSEDTLWIATGHTSPSSPNTHNNLGDVYGRGGDKEGALREFQKAIELKPNYADAYHNLANTYRELGKNDLALENYQKALKFNPYLWQSYQNVAAILFEQNDLQAALEYMRKAVAINPANPNLRISLGVIYLKLGDQSQAKEAFEQALRLDPQNQVAQQALQSLAK